MIRSIILSCLLTCTIILQAQQTLNYYLPDIQYDDKIPSPEAVLGYQVGEWHVNHDQLVYYVEKVASLSDRITIETYARSYENRPLLLLTITSPDNHEKLDQIRNRHLENITPDGQATKDNPVVIYQGFSIHGNEASGSNASLLYLYYLAAGQSDELLAMLDNVVILFDPSFNPDGMNRFASWVNTHKSKNLITDPSSREYREAWPGGRTNHYWFDLNRDWLPTQHPESQGRIKNFQKWRPNVLTDHHEMGSSSTFFFMPGIQSRVHPLTPKRNQTLTFEIGKYHQKALDKIGSLYFTEEGYDDFYYGKGSSYPDAQGCIGILFEQASARGHIQETVNGLLTFPYAIRNQMTTAISTLEASHNLKEQLNEFQREHFVSGLTEAKSDSRKGYVFGHNSDGYRLKSMIELLQRHDIEVYHLSKNTTIEGKAFNSNTGFVVPLEQMQYRLIKSMFDPITQFQDSLFYDVSTWTIPYAFNIPYNELKSTTGLVGEKADMTYITDSRLESVESPYGYIFEWDEYLAPRALNQILKAGLRAKVAAQPLSAVTTKGMLQFDYGTINVPAHNQDMDPDDIKKLMQKIVEENNITIYGVASGLTPQGIDLGSRNFEDLRDPKLLLLVGRGVRSYDAGEIWHLLDQRYDMQISMVELNRFNGLDLDRYNTLVLASGSYGSISDAGVEKLKRWIRDGGNLILFSTAIRWAKSKGLAKVEFKTAESPKGGEAAYKNLSATNGASVIGGAIFQTKLDLTHPLCYGYNDAYLPVFRRGTMFVEPSENPFATPVRYTDKPLLSGWINYKNKAVIGNTAGARVSRLGSGRVISLVDNTNFRAFWYGTNKLFANAIFFGHTISSGAAD
ncbi:MAG: zinc carboxypeptidase [Bacteroidia bacterium]|nr:zinc carboxypeptidase [Bacteroidia bacterium]